MAGAASSIPPPRRLTRFPFVGRAMNPAAAAAAGEAKPQTSVEKTAVFRGTWVPTIDRPVRFGAFQYLPVPPPQQPKSKPPPAVVEQGPAPAKEEPPPPQRQQPAEPLERMRGPLPDWDVLFTIVDREREYRACITKDGTVYNNLGQVLGFVNRDLHECGSAEEMYMGCVVSAPFDNVFQVRDSEDGLAGYIDMGTASIKDAMGGTVVDMESGGILKHPNGTYLGQFMGVKGFHEMQLITLYLCLLDPGMCSDVSG